MTKIAERRGNEANPMAKQKSHLMMVLVFFSVLIQKPVKRLSIRNTVWRREYIIRDLRPTHKVANNLNNCHIASPQQSKRHCEISTTTKEKHKKIAHWVWPQKTVSAYPIFFFSFFTENCCIDSGDNNHFTV